MPLRRLAIVLATLTALNGTRLHAQRHERVNADSLNALAAVQRFHASLARGDSETVMSMLSSDIVVLESGMVERRADYRKNHLPEDIEFERAVTATRSLVSLTVVGDAAWVSTTTTSKGTFKGRTVNSEGAELIVLTRVKSRDGRGRWMIRAIHWSSRRR